MKRILTVILIVALGCAKNKDEQQVVGSGGLAAVSRGTEQGIGYAQPTSFPMVARMDDIEKPQLVCRPCGGLYNLEAFR